MSAASKSLHAMLFAFLLLLGYVMVLGIFAFRPFHRIPGLSKGTPSTGLEDARGAAIVRQALVETGRMTLAAVVYPDPLDKHYTTCMITLSRDNLDRNFTLGQYRDGVSFRLRTTETDHNASKPSLLIPFVFEGQESRHVAATYDGDRVRLFVDGTPRTPELALSGNFDNWARNHLLAIGSEPPGGAEWKGRVESFSIYDRALKAEEIEALAQGEHVSGAVYSFQGEMRRGGMRRLRYRNLFVFTDPIFNIGDCIANIIGFVPLAFLTFFSLPVRCRQRKILILLLPALLGFLISGTIEILQQWLVGRVPTVLDIAYNLSGALLGSVLLWLAIFLKQRASSLMKGR